MQLSDHLLALMVTVLPVWSAWKRMPLLIAEIERGNTALRSRAYVMVAVQETVLGVLLLGYWALARRSFAVLGLRMDLGGISSVWLWATGVFCLAWVALHTLLLRGAAGRNWFRARSRRVLSFLPHTIGERNRFLLIALTAGVWEEVFFRGFMIWYLKALLGIWPAIIVSSLVFAAAHIYQGWLSVGAVALLGVLLAASLVWTGTLWPAMVMHLVVDINAAFTGYRLHNAPESVAPAA